MSHFLKDCPQLNIKLRGQMNALAASSSDDAKSTEKKVRFRDQMKGKGKKTGNPSSLNALMEDPDELSDSDPDKEDDDGEDDEVFSDNDTPSSRMLNSMMSKLNTKEKELLNSMKGNSPGPSSRQAPDPAKERARIAELMRH